MRSSSSELLLDEQEELRKRKLQILVQPKKVTKPPVRTFRERAWFYTTCVLALFAVSSGSSLLFLVPLYVDPAISTLVADFVTEPVLCTTSRREDLIGLFNCSWNSCREGCTSDVYRCIHIYVNYDPDILYSPPQQYDLYNGSTTVTTMSTTTAATTANWINSDNNGSSGFTEDAVLLVNIKGCGYPPHIHCNNFTDLYGVEGTEFPCYYSRENRTVVLPHYNQEEHVTIIIHYFAVPFVITLATSVALCVMHCDCRCRNVAHGHVKRQSRRPRIHDLSDGSISTRVDMLTPGPSACGYPREPCGPGCDITGGGCGAGMDAAGTHLL